MEVLGLLFPGKIGAFFFFFCFLKSPVNGFCDGKKTGLDFKRAI